MGISCLACCSAPRLRLPGRCPRLISAAKNTARAIFWGQTAGRVSESFAHRSPWWYYLPLLPLILFPWFVFPRFWIGLRNIKSEKSSHFLAAWLLLTLAGFSLVSGKQAKYLVPCFPRSRYWSGTRSAGCSHSRAGGKCCRRRSVFSRCPRFSLSALAAGGDEPAGVGRGRSRSGRSPSWCLPAPLLLFVSRKETAIQVRALAFAMLAAFAVAGAGVIPAFVPYSDPGPAARHLATLQEEKVPLAHLGKYHAQYNFVGRLRAPIAILDPQEVKGWVAAHPAGQVLTVERNRYAGAGGGPDYQAPFRGAWFQAWRGEALLVARPDLR